MADVLANIPEAAWAWWQSIIQSQSLYQDYSNGADTCGPNNITWKNRIVFEQLLLGNAGATLIGTDSATGFSYWHLTSLSSRWRLFTKAAWCVPCVCPSLIPPVQYFSGVGDSTESDLAVAITDGGSDTRPIDGHPIIPHTGLPVAAAVQLGTGAWYAFAGGDASAPTIAAAAAATGTGGLQDSGILTSLTLDFNWT